MLRPGSYSEAMVDQEWAAFREEMFGTPYMVWHDGPDFTVICAEYRIDPERVERMLLRGIADQDPVAADTIRHLELDEAAGQRFAERLLAQPAAGTMAVRVSESLAALTGDERFASRIAQVLTEPVHWGERIDAAMSLRHFAPTEELITALERGVRDEDNLVRHHSAESLLHFAHDAQPEISDHDAQFRVLIADDPDGWARLARELGDAARAANDLPSPSPGATGSA